MRPNCASAAVRAARADLNPAVPCPCFPGSACSPCTAQSCLHAAHGTLPADTTRGSRCAALLRSGAAARCLPCLPCPPSAQQQCGNCLRQPGAGRGSGGCGRSACDAGRPEMGCGLFPAQTSPRGSQRFVLGNGSNLRGMRGDVKAWVLPHCWGWLPMYLFSKGGRKGENR